MTAARLLDLQRRRMRCGSRRRWARILRGCTSSRSAAQRSTLAHACLRHAHEPRLVCDRLIWARSGLTWESSLNPTFRLSISALLRIVGGRDHTMTWDRISPLSKIDCPDAFEGGTPPL